MLTFTEEAIREQECIKRSVIKDIERGFIDQAPKEVQMPPIMKVNMESYNGEMDVKNSIHPEHDKFVL